MAEVIRADSPQRWSIHVDVDVLEAERFETGDNSMVSKHRGDRMLAQMITINSELDGQVIFSFSGPNLNPDGSLGQFRLVHFVAGAHAILERCPETYHLVAKAALDLINHISDERSKAVATLAGITYAPLAHPGVVDLRAAN
jgi:hypothetical protein